MGESPAAWYSAAQGLFSDQPHICLCENFWDAGLKVATERYFIIEGLSGGVIAHVASTQAYGEADYRSILEGCGFGEIHFHPSMSDGTAVQNDFCVIVGAEMTAAQPAQATAGAWRRAWHARRVLGRVEFRSSRVR